MLALLTNKYVLGAIGIVTVIGLAIWRENVVYKQGFVAGQSECQIAATKAADEARDASKKKADELERGARAARDKLQAEIRSLRDAKDPTNCYNTSLPADLLKRLRDTYDSYSK